MTSRVPGGVEPSGRSFVRGYPLAMSGAVRARPERPEGFLSGVLSFRALVGEPPIPRRDDHGTAQP